MPVDLLAIIPCSVANKQQPRINTIPEVRTTVLNEYLALIDDNINRRIGVMKWDEPEEIIEQPMVQ